MAISPTTPAQPGKASTTRTLFSRTTAVSQVIQADAAHIWALLTDAGAYPSWNSTIVSLDGQIAPGQKIQLVSTLDPKRTFSLKVKTFEPQQRLVWGDALGSRDFLLQPQADGSVLFTMSEKIGGPLFPLFAGMIPPFDTSFEQFAADLKAHAEKTQ